MWGSFDELFDEAFREEKLDTNFMTESNAKVLYFNLLSKYKLLQRDFRLVNKKYKQLKFDYDGLTKKYLNVTESSDLVPGRVYRNLLSKYKSLSKDFDKLFNANITLSDELTYFKSLDETNNEEDIS